MVPILFLGQYLISYLCQFASSKVIMIPTFEFPWTIELHLPGVHLTLALKRTDETMDNSFS